MYEQRYQYLKSVVDPENPYVKVAPIVKCESYGHLMEVLDGKYYIIRIH